MKTMDPDRLAQSAGPLFPFPLDGPDVQPVDLSGTPPADLGAHIAALMHEKGARLLYGGYLERREVYARHALFRTGDEARSIHLGLDLWTEAGTPVLAPLDGTVHSFADNAGEGNYGPTVILRHITEAGELFTLYGHLARTDLAKLRRDMPVRQHERIGALGTEAENGGWPPNLHFQLIRDLGGHSGDYPGVCRASEQARFANNCPDPRLLLNI